MGRPAKTFVCPSCGAMPGQPCVSLRAATVATTKRPHRARVCLAKRASKRTGRVGSGVVGTLNAKFAVGRVLGTYAFEQPRRAALDAATTLALRGVEVEVIEEVRHRQYTVVDADGVAIRYVRKQG